MDREEVLAVIEAAYDARMHNDTGTLSQLWADGAEFDFAGEETLLEVWPAAGRGPGPPTVEAVMGLVDMTSRTTVQAVIEGRRAVILSQATVSFAKREPFETLLCHVWELDEAGKVSSLIEFADTAKIVSEMQALSRS